MPITKEQHLGFIKRDIKQAKETGLKLNAILLAKGCCSECEKIDGMEISFEEVLKTKPLPHKSCTREPSCICCYVFKPMRDENGRLIRKEYTIAENE